MFLETVANLVKNGYCVNFEYCGELNRIVIGYEYEQLRVLNLRNMTTGETIYPNEISKTIPAFRRYLVDFTEDFSHSYEDILRMKGIGGFVLVFEDGRVCKVKTKEYCALHKTKDSVNNPKALFEACLYETSDDLRSIFHDDKVAIRSIENMENLVRKEYNHRYHVLQDFFNQNKDLSRKDYAIKGQSELKDMFSMAMNFYLGKCLGLKEWMMKNYRMFVNDTIKVESE